MKYKGEIQTDENISEDTTRDTSRKVKMTNYKTTHVRLNGQL